MDIHSVLEATFPIPTVEPAWQHELLLRLERGDMASTEAMAANATFGSALPRVSIADSDCLIS